MGIDVLFCFFIFLEFYQQSASQLYILMKVDRPEIRKDDKSRLKLRERLSLPNIYRELSLIANMNKHLEIPLEPFLKMDLLGKMSRQEVLKLVQSVPFLKYIKQSEHSKRECIRIEYENEGRILLVTGIQRQYIENMISQFNFSSRKYGEIFNSKSPYCKIVHCNQFWFALEATTDEIAAALKKFLRNEKHNLDENNKKEQYKIAKRRIRIVIVKEDLFTILIDAMTEFKAEIFQKDMVPPTGPQRRRSQQAVTAQPGRAIYRPLLYNNMQNYNYRNDKEDDFSDGFSESNSLNSDLFDPNKLKDIIQTSDQGIQSENNSVIQPQEEPEQCSPRQMHSSPLLALHTPRTPEEIKQEEQKETQHQNEAILRSQILRSDAQEFGIEEGELKKILSPRGSPKKRQNSIEHEGICTQKMSPVYNRYQTNPDTQLWPSPPQKPESFCQTQQPLYSVIPDHLMRRCLQQFKSRAHSQMVELPDWLKSQSENERNRHRFFSSLCKPKLINRKQPF